MTLCPCGSAALFNDCCQPIINQVIPADSAEKLMRSRFSAYATNNAAYIYHTYANSSRQSQSVADIQQWADECHWLALEIHHSDTTQVEFSAYYITDHNLCVLRENSNFILENDEWRYVDGNISQSEVIAKVKRNEVCPCNRYSTAITVKKGKKYKHCCGAS